MSDLSHVVTACSGVDNDGARCRSAAEIDAVSSIKLVQKKVPGKLTRNKSFRERKTKWNTHPNKSPLIPALTVSSQIQSPTLSPSSGPFPPLSPSSPISGSVKVVRCSWPPSSYVPSSVGMLL